MSFSHNRKRLFGTNWLLLLASLGFLFTAGAINQRIAKPEMVLTKQESAVNVNKYFLTLMSAGNRRLLTDLLWVQTLLESDQEHYKKKDYNNWMFIRFNTIAHLDPLFYENYRYGGLYLSVVKDDPLAGNAIMENGLQYYPDDYHLNQLLGFNYYFELAELNKGLPYLEKIKNNPMAPPFLSSIIAKLKVQLGVDLDDILSFLKDQYKNTADPKLRNKLEQEIYSVQAERDLRCLNEGKAGCSKLDAMGRAYVFRQGKFHTQIPFTPFRLRHRSDRERLEPVTTL